METLVKKKGEPQLHLSTERKHPSYASTSHVSQLAGRLMTLRYDISPPPNSLGPCHLSRLLLAVVILPGVPCQNRQRRDLCWSACKQRYKQGRLPPADAHQRCWASGWGNANKSLLNFSPAVNQLITFPPLCWAAEYIINCFEIFRF